MPKINILHIITKLELGGAQKNCLAILAGLDKNRFKPFLAAGTEGILVKDAFDLDGVTFKKLPSLRREINFFLTFLLCFIFFA